jgi:broad specificity phosphatase PhoE
VTVRLVLVSHASTSATREARFPGDEPLDARGADIAASARGSLRRFDAVLRGPETRCAQTAAALGLEAVAHPSLADLDLGAWRGRTLADIEPERPSDLLTWLSDPEATPHGGESLAALASRVSAWLDGLPSVPSRIAAVTHPAVVRAAVLHALGAPLAGFWRLDVAPLTQTWFSHHAGRWQLRETGHALISP